MQKYVFDTNAYNRLLDDDLNLIGTEHEIIIYGSHIQLRELKATKECKRREALLSVFHATTDTCLKTESMVFPIEFGSTKFGDETYNNIRNELDTESNKLERRRRKGKLKNNPNDAQIGETAIKNGCTLVTDDPELLMVVSNRSSKALTYDEFKEQLRRLHH